MENTHSRGQSSDPQRNVLSFDGELVAKIFKHYRRQQNPYVNHELSLKFVPVKSFYKKHKVAFDKFAEIASKNNFDVDSYMSFCVKNGIKEDSILQCIASSTMVEKFRTYVKTKEFRMKVYKWVMKSVKNIALECVAGEYFSVKGFLKDIISEKKLGNYVASGRISMYYLAAIPHFNKAIPKLDYFSRLELQLLEEHYDIYHSDVNKAFLQVKNQLFNPIDLTDQTIAKIRERHST